MIARAGVIKELKRSQAKQQLASPDMISMNSLNRCVAIDI